MALRKKLELILEGKAPYDIFVRWEPLEKQPTGWDPDRTGGVRLNIRRPHRALWRQERRRCPLRDKPNIIWNKAWAQTLCDHLAWYTASGTYRTAACLGLLEKLETRGLIRLPAKRAGGAPRRVGGDTGVATSAPSTAIQGRLGDLGAVGLRIVEGREETARWNATVARYHHLGYKPPAGFRLRYFVESEQGLLGCVLLAGVARALAARDQWIGWSRCQRLKNLAWVVNNTRYLVLPWVVVQDLASHVLGQLVRRVAADWQERFGYQPVLLETFVDPAQYRGTCYRASGWEWLGQTTGQGLVRAGRHYQSTVKDVCVRPLAENFRELLCAEELVGRQLAP